MRRTTGLRRGLVRTFAGAGGAALVLAAAGPAAAAPASVERGTLPPDDVRLVETELCPFPIEIHEVLTGTYTVHLDADGDFVRAEVHIAYDADLSANGITLHESDRWTDFYFPGGTHRKVGQLAHVSGPGGLVVNDAGILFTVGGDDVVVDHHGRVTEFIGEVLCPALQGG